MTGEKRVEGKISECVEQTNSSDSVGNGKQYHTATFWLILCKMYSMGMKEIICIPIILNKAEPNKWSGQELKSHVVQTLTFGIMSKIPCCEARVKNEWSTEAEHLKKPSWSVMFYDHIIKIAHHLGLNLWIYHLNISSVTLLLSIRAWLFTFPLQMYAWILEIVQSLCFTRSAPILHTG